MPYWTHASPNHVQSATRLETGQRNLSLVDDTLNPESHEGTLDVAAALQLQAVVDLPIIRCRPSTFVFINSLVRIRLFVLPQILQSKFDIQTFLAML